MLEIRGLRKVHPGRAGEEREGLGRVDLAVPEGQFACVLGPSGCGKTTLLRCVAGLLGPSEGEVRLDGEVITEPPPGMAVVFQEYARSLFSWKSVRANVELPLRARGVPRADRRERARATLESVGLADRADAQPWQLSGGMQQRVAIARAIVTEPRVLLMDEPFAAVDAQTREELEDLVRGLAAAHGMTVLFVTHDIDEAIYLGDRVVVLGAGSPAVRADLTVDLGTDRHQLATRVDPRFAELRARLYRGVQEARRPAADGVAAS